jgi:radical SAM protein with 4Fe4S-binding SPASM domain
VDCPGCPEVTLGEVGDELLLQLQGRRFPLGGSFELTECCNLACVHCYISQSAVSREAAARELALPEVRSVLDQLAEAGCLLLLLTGGEVLLRPDFCDIWRYAKQKGMLVSLFTNGTMLTRRIADFLAEWRPTAVEITLYGATQQTYERVTQVPGSYERCMRGIELALDRGLRLNLKSMVLKANRHELDGMRALAVQLGVPYRFDGVLFPRLDGDQSPWAQRLSAGEIVGLDREYPEREEEFDRLYRQLRATPVRRDYVYTCGAGYRTFHVDSAGRLSLCMMARRPTYDLLQGSFQEGWEQVLGAALRKKRTLDTPCRTCTVGALCTQCPGWSQLVHGDDETPVEYVCEMGRLRAAEALAAGAMHGVGTPVAVQMGDAKGEASGEGQQSGPGPQIEKQEVS